MVKSMALAFIIGKMDLHMKVGMLTTRNRAMESLLQKMERDLRANGWTEGDKGAGS